MGGPNHASPLIPVQEDPALRTLRAVANARRTLRAGFTTVRNLGLFVQTGRHPARRGPDEGHRHGLVRRTADRPGRACHQPHRRPPRPHHVPGLRPPRPAPHRRGGDRQRGGRGPQGRPLPDQVRRPGHQGQRLGWGDVAHRPGRRPPVLHRGAGGDRRRGPPGRPEGRRPLPRGRGHPGGARVGHRLHRARFADERRDPRSVDRTRRLPGGHHLSGRRHGRVARRPRAAGQGGRGVPPGPGDHLQGHPARRPRSPVAPTPRPSPTAGTPRSWSPWSTGA